MSSKIKLTLLFIFYQFLLSNCTTSGLREIKKWHVHEIVLSAEKHYANPYLDVSLAASFVSPSGKKIRVKGFWDGDDLFKVRFTPTEEGTWSYTVNNNQQDNGLKADGVLKVNGVSKATHGFVRRDAGYPYHFTFDDGTRYYMCGTTYYNMILNALEGDRWKVAIDSAKVFGINKFRTKVFTQKNESTPYAQVYPFEGEETTLDFTRPNLTLWHKMDEIVQYAYERGMVVDLMPFGFGKSSYSDDVNLDIRFLRYVLARYAAYPNIIWCLVNEWNYRYKRLGKDKAYWDRMGKIVSAEDPWMENGEYLRPLSIHQQTRIDFQFFDCDWVVHAIIQLGVRNGQGVVPDEWNISADVQPQYRHSDEWGNAGIVYNLGHQMPVVNDEFGYIGEPRDRAASDSPDREDWPRFTRERHRNVIWGIAVAGGYGSAGDKNAYEDGKPYFSANWHSDPPEYRDIQHMVDFFTNQGIAYWKMHSLNEIITEGNRVYALAEPGLQYIFYAATGGNFRADIEKGDYAVKLFNPRTGEMKSFDAGDDGSFSLPDQQDWVIYMRSK